MSGLHRRAVLAGTISTTLNVPGIVRAQADWPKGPIKLVVPFPPGGGTDPIARIIAAKLGDTAGWQIVVENKPGAAGVIGAAVVAKSPADGQSWLVTFDSHILSPAFTNNMPYKESELANLMLIGRAPLVIVCHPDRPYRNFIEVAADAKSRPGKVSIGFSTSTVQMEIDALNRLAGIELLPVPYKGVPATVNDVLGDSLAATLVDPGNGLPHIKSGQLRALGVTSLKRNPLTPDIPAISETLPGYDFPSWTAMVGPANMPRDTVNKIHAAMQSALKQKELVDKFAQAGTLPYFLSPDELKALIDAETAKWIKAARDANIQPE